jgi:hypothetical protein
MKGLMNTTFRYDKEMIFSEFNIAKEKDIKLGKGDDNKVHTNRVKFLKDMIELEAKMPEVFEYVNINFKRLLLAYESPNPREHFYKSVFGKSFAEVQAEQSGYDDAEEVVA